MLNINRSVGTPHNTEWCIVSQIIPNKVDEAPYWQINLIPPHSGLYEDFNFGLPIAYRFETKEAALEFAPKIDEFMNENHNYEKELAKEIWSEMSFFEKLKAKWVNIFIAIFTPLEPSHLM